ncbi:manganese/iron transport system ATP-binding protein [Agromyces sp. CF514]|uniref:metal ABC transporter ATP-binding protein n=1 Tax=Agromyces sp. CF514 TaxID=1881031 RepID=UPI0008E07B5F|nr:metal ABC transporter ATP-binding protein [Agromyces sp. CF514]SFR67076.1 manganese/iron transport system ATP-binding protein [Agromyces sp. CF514]
MSSSAVLTFEDAAFTHPGGDGVSELDFSIAAGEAVALIGPNGAGKSTLLRGVLGLVPLTHGSMALGPRVDASGPGSTGRDDVVGRGGAATHAERGMVGFLPQTMEFDVDFPISLEQVVMQGRYRQLGLLRWPGRADRAAVRRALETVGLADSASKRFGSLSGGQRQRGLLARALAADPSLLLLDEPFNGLDQPNRDALVETLRRLKADGVAVLVSTHDLELAQQVCDLVVLVNKRQTAFGPVSDALTLTNVQRCFEGVEVEIDEHTLVVPDHEGH